MMTRIQILVLHISVLLTAATGVVFAVMKYAMKSDDPFAVVNHPLQPWMLSSHVVIAAVAVFALGWVFGNHMLPGIRNPEARKRPSGVWSMLAIAPMVLSGYLLQVSTSEALRQAMAVAHWISSGWFLIGFTVHLVWRRASRTVEDSGGQRRESVDQLLQPRERSLAPQRHSDVEDRR